MNDVLSTLVVVAIVGIGIYVGFGYGILFMDSGPTKAFWIGESAIILTILLVVYAVIHWAAMT